MKNMKAPATAAIQYFKKEFFLELFATVLMALGIKVFAAPNLIVGGGVSGISSVLYVLFDLPIGLTSLIMNIPLLLLGWRILGNDFTFRTLRLVALVSFSTDVLVSGIPAYNGEKLAAALFGGALLGIGLGIILNRGGSTGGTDILVKIIQKKLPHITLGNITLILDASVVTMAAISYKNADTIVYGVAMIFVSSTVIDKIILGAQSRKLSIIVTSYGEEVTQELLVKLDRGVTVLNGSGGYTRNNRAVLISVVENRQVVKLKQLVYGVDPKAFIIISTAVETLGKGFKSIEEI